MKSLFLFSILFTVLTSFSNSDETISINSNDFIEKIYDQDKTEHYVVTSENAVLRSGPKEQFNPVVTLEKGAKIKVLNNDFGDWCIVEFEEKKGFVQKSYIKPVNQDSSIIKQ